MEVGVGAERVSNPASTGQGQEDFEDDEANFLECSFPSRLRGRVSSSIGTWEKARVWLYS